MKRRRFLHAAGSAALGLVLPRWRAQGAQLPSLARVRLVRGRRFHPIERAALDDAASLLSRALGRAVPVVDEPDAWDGADVLVASRGTSDTLSPSELPRSDSLPGAFRITRPANRPAGPAVVVAGADAEGARNGIYALLERLGFAFFRDGETVPNLGAAPAWPAGIEADSTPAFRWRGDMIWDNYLGPQRYCAAVWTEAEWERALRFMARRRMNFLEFYPPLDHVLQLAFPDARGLADGPVWTADHKHRLAQRVLARGRALGIRFMYVLNYGYFPEPVRDLYPTLEWANGHLCAHQPELAEMCRSTWRVLVREFGTDHLYAIRHRGEEGQSYSDPCRSITKPAGYRQAIAVLEDVDADATITAWTWGERLPDLFAELPTGVRAAHIRHGMGGVFADRGVGREQTDGAPNLPAGRPWLSGQFTVFGGHETLLQTPWCDAAAIARDATAAAGARSEGFFQWPEWSDTSPWLSEVIASVSWQPGSMADPADRLQAYASARHGTRAHGFVAAMLPLVRAGNARVTSTPRKRLLVPWFLERAQLFLLESVRAGLRVMLAVRSSSGSTAQYDRDLVDVATWTAVRQAHACEAAGYLAHAGGDQSSARQRLADASLTWQSLHSLLSQCPELSIIEAARSAARHGPVSARVVDSFWTSACDFYGGYPLVMSPEAIELVYLEQLARLRALVDDGARQGSTAALDEPGWFWHDFPDRRWADVVRRLPAEDSAAFESTIRLRVTEAVAGTKRESISTDLQAVEPASPTVLDSARTKAAIGGILGVALPPALNEPTRLYASKQARTLRSWPSEVEASLIPPSGKSPPRPSPSPPPDTRPARGRR